MAPSPQHKHPFETFLNAPGAHPFIDTIEPLFTAGPDTDSPFLIRNITNLNQQQLFWQSGEVRSIHDRLCITLGGTSITIALSHFHDAPEQATLVIDRWRPALYETRGVVTPIHPTAYGEEAAERFLPLFEHSVGVFDLGRLALAERSWANVS